MISGVRVASLSEVVSETFDFGMKRWGLLAGVFAVLAIAIAGFEFGSKTVEFAGLATGASVGTGVPKIKGVPAVLLADTKLGDVGIGVLAVS